MDAINALDWKHARISRMSKCVENIDYCKILCTWNQKRGSRVQLVTDDAIHWQSLDGRDDR